MKDPNIVFLKVKKALFMTTKHNVRTLTVILVSDFCSYKTNTVQYNETNAMQL